MHLFFLFIFGLLFGSFINALVYRLHAGETLLGRSYCPQCRKQIAWFDNIPLFSFLYLRGRCRSCRELISLRYPLVELATGLSFLLIGQAYLLPTQMESWGETLWVLTFAFFIIAIAAYDLSYMEVPVVPILVGSLVTLLVLFFQGIGSPTGIMGSPFVTGLIGAFVLAGFFFMLVFFSGETWMGWGDVWVGFLVGAMVGWPAVIFLLTISSFLGALVGMLLIALGKKKMGSAVPFVPFLAAGTILSLCLEDLFMRLFPLFFL